MKKSSCWPTVHQQSPMAYDLLTVGQQIADTVKSSPEAVNSKRFNLNKTQTKTVQSGIVHWKETFLITTCTIFEM